MTSPTPAADSQSRTLALVKLMRDTGVAVVDVSSAEYLGTVGDDRHPHGLAVHPGGRWVAVAFAGSGTVVVVDCRSRSVVARQTVGTAPIGIEYAPDGHYLYVTGYGSLPDDEEPGLTVLRATAEQSQQYRLEPVAHRPIGKCAGLVVDGDDLWVALKDDDAVVRLDGRPPFELRDRIDVPGDPQDLAYAPAYDLLGVNNVEHGSVSFVDVSERRLAATVDAPNPRGGAVSRTHDRWFVGNTDGDGVTVVDIGDEPRRLGPISIGTATAFPDATVDGEFVVVDAYDDDRVTFLDVSTGSIVARVRTGATPRHPRFARGGDRCYVPNVDDDSLSVVDTSPLYESDEPIVRETIPLPADSAPSSCFLAGGAVFSEGFDR